MRKSICNLCGCGSRPCKFFLTSINNIDLFWDPDLEILNALCITIRLECGCGVVTKIQFRFTSKNC